MTIIEALNYINRSIKSSFGSSIEALTKHTFKVQFPKVQKIDGRVDVKFPEVQKIAGKVDVSFPDTQKVVGHVTTDTKEGFDKVVAKLEDTKQLFGQKGIQVNNFPKYPTKIEVLNFPKEKELDFTELASKLDALNESIKKLPTKFPDFPKIPGYPEQKPITFPKSFVVDNLESLKSSDPTEYVPVRLTDGEEFYKAIEEFYQQVSSAVTFTDSQNKKTGALVDEDRHVQVDVVTMPEIVIPAVTGGATEAKQDYIIEAIENKVIPIATEIEVNNFPTTFPLPAEQIEALTPPTPTPAIEGFSTEAKQDTLVSKIDTLIAELETKPSVGDIEMSEMIPMLRSILMAIANPSYVDKSANQMRSQVTGSLTTVTTVTTVTNLTNFGSFPADHLQRMDNMTAWATNIRSLIT